MRQVIISPIITIFCGVGGQHDTIPNDLEVVDEHKLLMQSQCHGSMKGKGEVHKTRGASTVKWTTLVPRTSLSESDILTIIFKTIY